MKRILILALVLLFVLNLSARVGFALTPEDLHAIQNDSVWHRIYSDCSSSSTSSAGATVSKPGLVFLIGDSIGSQVLGTLSQAIPQHTGWSFGGDAIHSRALSGGAASPDGLGAVDQNAENIKNATSVVIELGTNTAGFSPENVDQMTNKIRALAPTAVIYWVDTAVVSRPDYATSLSGVNNVIYSQAGTDKYQIISWNKKVFGDGADPKNINSDAPSNGLISTADGLNVHLSDSGIPAMTDLIASTVTGTAAGSTQSANSATDSTSCACTAGGSTTLTGANDKEKIWNFLIGKGLTPPQAAGVMGNLQAESGFNPKRVQNTSTPDGDKDNITVDGVTGYGIAQWTSQGRQQALADLAASRGVISGDLALQLDFLFQEATDRGDWDKLKTATTVEDAARNWHKNYERSDDGPERVQGRVNFALAIMDELGSGTSGGSGGGAGCASSAAAKDITYKDRAELVQRIKSNPQFQVSTKHGYPVESDIDTVWAAVTSGATSGTQDAILKTLVIILEQYAQPNNAVVPVELFNRTQGACGDFDKGATGYGPYTSSHAYGLAMDIDTTSMDPQDAAQLFKWIYDNKVVLNIGELEHDPVADGASNIKFGGDYTYPDSIQADHRDHIHVGVKGTGAVSPGCTSKPSGETI